MTDEDLHCLGAEYLISAGVFVLQSQASQRKKVITHSHTLADRLFYYCKLNGTQTACTMSIKPEPAGSRWFKYGSFVLCSCVGRYTHTQKKGNVCLFIYFFFVMRAPKAQIEKRKDCNPSGFLLTRKIEQTHLQLLDFQQISFSFSSTFITFISVCNR